MGADPQIVRSRIEKYVLNETLEKDGKIKNDTLIFQEGYFDSMGFVRLITFLEREFGVKSQDTDLVESNFASINAITDFVLRKSQ